MTFKSRTHELNRPMKRAQQHKLSNEFQSGKMKSASISLASGLGVFTPYRFRPVGTVANPRDTAPSRRTKGNSMKVGNRPTKAHTTPPLTADTRLLGNLLQEPRRSEEFGAWLMIQIWRVRAAVRHHIFRLNLISSKIMLIHGNCCETPVRNKVTMLV